jgi:hypothetical protein
MENTMKQHDSELATIITDFLNEMRKEHGTDSYAAGYFSAWVRQFGESDPQVRDRIIRQLTYSMEICKNA